jgi:hypothetical protein
VSTPETQASNNSNIVDVKDLVGLFIKYPNQTVWISMRPDSHQVEAPGFQVVELRANFRNSPKIHLGVKHFFEELEVFPGNFN